MAVKVRVKVNSICKYFKKEDLLLKNQSKKFLMINTILNLKYLTDNPRLNFDMVNMFTHW
jgi:hypothetical protein